MQVLPADTSSWISVAVLRPRKLSRCSFEEFVASISSVSQSFHNAGFLRSAVLTGYESNLVAVYSIWHTLNSEPIEVTNLPKAKHVRKLLNDMRTTLSQKPQTPPSLPDWQVDSYLKAIRSVAKVIDLSWCEVSCWDSEQLSSSSSTLISSPSSLPSPSLLKQPFISLNDIVHLRTVIGKEPDAEDMLSYSCLAILKSYFHTMDGIMFYTFFKSLDTPKMIGLGVWQNIEEAVAFLNSEDGAPEECYWRSMGAKTKLDLYQVSFMTSDHA